MVSMRRSLCDSCSMSPAVDVCHSKDAASEPAWRPLRVRAGKQHRLLLGLFDSQQELLMCVATRSRAAKAVAPGMCSRCA